MTRPISALELQQQDIAEEVVRRCYDAQPALAAAYGETGRAKCLQDQAFHLRFLAQAVERDQPLLFADYAAWVSAMLASRGIPTAHLEHNFRILAQVMAERLEEGDAARILPVLQAGQEHLQAADPARTSCIRDDNPQRALASAYLDALVNARRQEAARLVLEAVDSGVSVRDVYLNVFMPCQYEVGRLWQVNRISVSQEHYCTAATQLVMSRLYPQIFSSARVGRTLVATCVSGDLHEIGIRMVSDFFEMAGWDTFYLGASTPSDDVCRTVCERKADVLALSATMTFHVAEVERLVRLVRAEAPAADLRILVGGRPFLLAEGLWRSVGADGFAADADAAVEVAERLISEAGPR